MALYVRDVMEVERTKLEQITRATTAPVRLVERARTGRLSIAGLHTPTTAAPDGASGEKARPRNNGTTARGPGRARAARWRRTPRVRRCALGRAALVHAWPYRGGASSGRRIVI